MKKTILIIAVLGILFSPAAANTKKLGLSIGAGYNNFSGIVKDVYSNTNISYAVDFSYRSSKIFELFLHTDFLSMKGNLTHSRGTSKLNIVPIELGVRFPFGSKISPYLGAGAGSYQYKETNEIGEASGSGFGFFGEAGLRFGFSSVFFDLKGKYTSLKINDIDLSNLKAIVSFGVFF